jgi:hypothetical protein
LSRKDIADKNIFEQTNIFTLKQISFLYLVKYFENEIDGTKMCIKKGDRLTDKDFDSLVYNLLIRLPHIEAEVELQISEVINGLRTNQDYQVHDKKVSELKSDILLFCKDIIKLRKIMKFKRYSGIVKIDRWPPDLYCRSYVLKESKATKNSLDKLPLTNLLPLSESRCSWDTLDDKVENLVIPSHMINLLVSKLKQSKFFGYKIKYLYSKKSKIIWDICLFLLFTIVTILFDKGINDSSKNAFGSLCWLGRNISAGFAFFIIMKIIFKDTKYWSGNFDKIREYIRK